MELWFSDYHTEHVKVSVKVEKQLFGEQTDYQRIDVFESKEFGRFLSSDGSIVFSEQDEFVYDEMIVHVPMAVHPHVRKVLVIGGGDGGVARELSYYDEIEEIDVVEPDEVFVEVCKKFFPDNACGLDDPRVKVYNADGLRFLRTKNDMYDLIINDAIDPLGHTETVSAHSKRMGSWYISMAVRFMTKTRNPVASCIARRATVFRSAVCIRRISRPVLPGTGCLDLRQKNIIRSWIWMRRAGKSAGSKPGIIRQTCIRARSCCQNM